MDLLGAETWKNLTMSLMSFKDIVGGRPLHSCPQRPPDPNYFPNPTISATFMGQALLCFLMAGIILVRWQSLKLFGRYMRSNYLSNHLWVWYFGITACSASLEMTRYLRNLPYFVATSSPVPQSPSPPHGSSRDELPPEVYNRNVDTGLLLGVVVLHALSLVFLVLALAWELRYRIGMPPDAKELSRSRLGRPAHHDYLEDTHSPLLPSPTDSSESLFLASDLEDEDRRRVRSSRKCRTCCTRLLYERRGSVYYFCYNRLALVLFFFNLVTLYLDVTPLPFSFILFWSYVGSFGLLQLLLWWLAVRILISPTTPPASSTARILSLSSSADHTEPEGPTRAAKCYLFLGVLLGLVHAVPSNLMSRFLYIISDDDVHHSDGHPTMSMPSSFFMDTTQCIRPIFDGNVSVHDVLQWIGLLSLVFWACFVRDEFNRVKERCVWVTVTQIQDTFGFSRPLPRSLASNGRSMDG